MTYGLVFEKCEEPNFEGYYYAHIPALDLTTHGLGIDGARAAAEDLVTGWLQVKREHGEPVPSSREVFFSTLEIADDALQVA